MHFYRKTVEEGQALFTVGYWEPVTFRAPSKILAADSEIARTEHGLRWVPLMDTSSEYEAMALVNYMNGGTGAKFVWNDPDDDLRKLVRNREGGGK
jgi:hypothetical protein